MIFWIVALVAVFYIARWRLRCLRIGGFNNRHVMITGCDSGFGYRLAKRLDSMGFNVFAACLTFQGSEELKKGSSTRLKTMIVDVTKENDIAKALLFVKTNIPDGKGLWGVVNNAGVTGPIAPSEWLETADWETPLRINLFGMISVNKAFLPLVRMTSGRIVNTASVLGRIATGPTAYVVSKYAVEGYSDSLRREIWRQGVSVHIIEPGAFKTNITDPKLGRLSLLKCYEKQKPEIQEFYGKDYLSRLQTVMDGLSKYNADGDLDKVVNAYLQALTARFPLTRYVVGFDANIFFRLLWNCPDWVPDMIFGYLYPKPQGATGR